MRKSRQNHISASRHLHKHPKRLLREGAWKPGKRGGKTGWKKLPASRR